MQRRRGRVSHESGCDIIAWYTLSTEHNAARYPYFFLTHFYFAYQSKNPFIR